MTPAPTSALLVKPGSMGDLVHALPVAAALKSAFPECRILWLVDDRWRSLLDGNPHIDRTVVFPRERFRGPLGFLRATPWAFRLRHLRPDLTIDLQGLLRSGLFARLAGSRKVLGLSDAREGARLFADTVAKVMPGEHSVLRYLRVCDPLGIPHPETPEFWIPSGKPHPAQPQAPYVLLHPFARGAGKSLSLSSLHALCLALTPHRIVLAGGRFPGLPALPGTHNLLGQTDLHELVSLIRGAAFMVSVDSGPAHIAAAVGTPLLAIHSWSDPALVGPFSKDADVWHSGTIRRQDLQATSQTPHARGELPEPSEIAAIADHVKNALDPSL